MNGAYAILRERYRQIADEGFNEEHDDQWVHGELGCAAIAYLIASDLYTPLTEAEHWWPWGLKIFKPDASGLTPEEIQNVRRENLVKAGALILAEIDRMDRAINKEEGE